MKPSQESSVAIFLTPFFRPCLLGSKARPVRRTDVHVVSKVEPLLDPADYLFGLTVIDGSIGVIGVVVVVVTEVVAVAEVAPVVVAAVTEVVVTGVVVVAVTPVALVVCVVTAPVPVLDAVDLEVDDAPAPLAVDETVVVPDALVVVVTFTVGGVTDTADPAACVAPAEDPLFTALPMAEATAPAAPALPDCPLATSAAAVAVLATALTAAVTAVLFAALVAAWLTF